jgi:CTP:molybdopterin cytidylyltransferase MocA
MPTPPRISGASPVLVVLGAGASRRFGGRPKALLEVDGLPAVRRVLDVGRETGAAKSVVVVGRHGTEIGAALEGSGAMVLFNERWEGGRTGSLQLALRSVWAGSDILLWPVDFPFVGPNTVRALGAAARGDRIATWVMPTFEGRGRHPVWLKPPGRDRIFRRATDEPLRSLLPRLGVQVRRVPVTDPWIRIGTDTPAEYADALDAWSRRS